MFKKIIGFKFRMEDTLSDAKEVAENVQLVEEGLNTIDVQIAEIETSVSFSSQSKLPFRTFTLARGFRSRLRCSQIHISD